MAVIINGNNTPTAGGVGYGNATELAFTGAGTSGQLLASGGASAPAFTGTPALGTPASGILSSCTVDGTDAVGFRNIPINSNSAAYTAVLADSGKVIFHPSTDANARTFTIPANKLYENWNFRIEDLSVELYESKIESVRKNLQLAIDLLVAEDYIYKNFIEITK